MKFELLAKILIISRYSCLLLVIYCSLAVVTHPSAFSQNKGGINIKGTISDEKGEGLPGVSIKVKGTTIGTVTDAKGNYVIKASNGNFLSFNCIGYLAKEIEVATQTVINVSLQADTKNLDEIVVVGYGTQKKSDVTGAVASVSKDRLERVPANDLNQVLQGSIAGVSVSSSGGANGTSNILIRGRNSISADTSPLIILDGIPYNGQLNDIAPNSIQSVEVLKDASSTAIYGSRGSNGVIIITSKQGQTGKAKLTYDGYYSIQNIANLPRLFNGAEYYHNKNERYASAGGQIDENFVYPSEQKIFDAGTWVSWPDEVFRQGQSQSHNVSISGGNENTKYYINGGILQVDGVAVNDNYSRITNRVNLETKFTNWLTFGTKTQFSYTDQGGLSANFSKVYSQNPLNVAYNTDGTINKTPYQENINSTSPLEPLLASNKDKSYQVLTNNYFNVSFPFIKGLQYRLNTGLSYTYGDQFTYYGRNTVQGTKVGGDGMTSKDLNSSQLIENIISYNRDFGKHKLFLTALYGYEGKRSDGEVINASGFPSDILDIYGMSQAKLIVPVLGYSKQSLISQMLRANYSYASRYLLTLTARRDGFSGFGAESKYGVFPSAALGWNISNEDFFQKSRLSKVVNNLKLRLSYGENGNQAVGPYETISRLGAADYVYGASSAPGYIPIKLGLDNLGWETTKSLNVGLDYGLFKNRITGDINVFNTNTYDLLLNRTISAVHGVGSITQNIGKTNNKGIEISVNSTNIATDVFTWSTTANFSFIKNRIVDLYGNGVNDIANKLFIGSPITANYDLKFDGVWQTSESELAKKYDNSLPGYIKIRDANGDMVINSDDRIIIGQRDPKTTWGIANTLTYKKLSLYFFMYGVYGVTKLNDLEVDGNVVYHNFWTPDNPTNKYWANIQNANIRKVPVYQNADFIRVKDITFAYDLSQSILKHIGIERAKIFVNGKNLFTQTKWTGADPELDTQQGIPLQKEYIFGLSIGL